jgi:hypothetical protein
MSEERYDTGYILDNLFRAKRKLGLNSGQFEVLCALVRHDCPDPRNGGQRKGVVWPSPSNGLRDLTGLSERNLRRLLDQLDSLGAITILNPEEVRGGRGKVIYWQINYEELDWKVNPDNLSGFVPVNPDNLSGESGKESESRNPPPPDPPPSSRPVTSPVAPPVLEEEEFPFLSPDERACLQSLQVSPALRQRVRQSEPGTLQAALQHLLSRREDILASGRSLEERFGGLLTGRFVPSPEREIPVKEEEASTPWAFCRACGVTHQGEHQCSSTGRGEPQEGEDRWLQEMRERAARAQRGGGG